MGNQEREWADEKTREEIQIAIQNTNEVEELFEHLGRLDAGFSDPMQLVFKQVEPGQDIEMKDDDNENEDEDPTANIEMRGNMQVKRKKIQFFKFWPKHQLQSAWRSYISM